MRGVGIHHIAASRLRGRRTDATRIDDSRHGSDRDEHTRSPQASGERRASVFSKTPLAPAAADFVAFNGQSMAIALVAR